MRSHWLTFACLLPFVVMLAIHRALNLSDAVMVATPPGEHQATLYNLVMVGMFYASVTGYLVHTFAVAARDRGWIALKLVLLAVGWTSVIIAGCCKP
jgi:hypothetical protein